MVFVSVEGLVLVWVLVEVVSSPRRERVLMLVLVSGRGWGRAVISVRRERRRVVVEGGKRMLVGDLGVRRDKGLRKRRKYFLASGVERVVG